MIRLSGIWFLLEPRAQEPGFDPKGYQFPARPKTLAKEAQEARENVGDKPGQPL